MSGKTEIFDLATTELRADWSLIEASAGTGKTFAIAGLVVRMVVSGFVDDVRKILVVTFTIDATEELKTRVRAALADALAVFEHPDDVAPDDARRQQYLAWAREYGDAGRARLAAALSGFDGVAIQTIHAFCHRVLQESAFESGLAFDLGFTEDEDLLIERAVHDAWRNLFHDADPWLARLVKAGKPWTPELFARVFSAWQRATGARYEPADHTLDEALDEWRTAIAGLQRHAHDHQGAYASLAPLKKKAGFAKDIGGFEAAFAMLRSLPEEPHAGWVQFARHFATSVITGTTSASLFKTAIEAFEGHPLFDACDDANTAARRVELAFVREMLGAIEKALAAIRARDHVVSFFDVLADLDRALRDEVLGPRLVDTVSSRFSVALIDEFQDTDALQFEIFRKLFAQRTVMLIGDPKQAIYAFRGADVFAYLDARSFVQRRFTLDRNWRSSPDLVRGVQSLFARVARPFVFGGIEAPPVEPARTASETALDGVAGRALTFWHIPKVGRGESHLVSRALLGKLVSTCRELLGSGASIDGEPLDPGHIAVLVRSNRQADEVLAALRAADIPALVGRANDVLAAPGTDELLRVLAALCHPNNARLVRAACATHLVGDDATSLRALLDDEDAWQGRVEEFRECHRRWHLDGIVAALEAAWSMWDTRRRLLVLPDGERRVGNLVHAVEVLHDEARRANLAPESLVSWFREERDRRQPPESRQLRLEREDRAVEIVTMHSSKGLEYDVVLCPFAPAPVTDRGEPLVVRERSGVVFDAGSALYDERKATAHVETLAEDLRLLYVALTRAKRRAYIAWDDNQQSLARTALAYLCHAPPSGAAGDDVAAALAAMTSIGSALKDGGLAGLQRVVSERPELYGLEQLAPSTEPTAARWGGTEVENVVLEAAQARIANEQLEPWMMMSFSSWVRGGADERPDREDADVVLLDSVDGGAAPPELADMFAFARGADAGVALHAVFEFADLAALDERALHTGAEQQLRRAGLIDSERHGAGIDPVATVVGLVERVARAVIPGWSFALTDVDPTRRIPEWSFTLPTGTLEPRALAEVFAAHGLQDVAARMESLTSERLAGFLVGFVDDIVEYDGRWYIVDWKSNHLGSDVGAYLPERLAHVVADHHYDLQLMLYIVALQRFLRSRLGAAYSYDTHVGGAADVFLRGVGAGAEHGFWKIRPDQALVDALDHFLQGNAE